jgi:hypothetical protein
MQDNGPTRRGFLAITGGAAGALPVQLTARVGVALVGARGIPKSLRRAGRVRWLNREGHPAGAEIAHADAVLVATADWEAVARIPADKPLYWMPPFPRDRKWLAAELKRRAATPVSFATFLSSGDYAERVRGYRHRIQRVRLFACGPGVATPCTVLLHLDFLRSVWPQVDPAGALPHSSGFDLDGEGGEDSWMNYRYDPHSCSAWAGAPIARTSRPRAAPRRIKRRRLSCSS